MFLESMKKSYSIMERTNNHQDILRAKPMLGLEIGD